MKKRWLGVALACMSVCGMSAESLKSENGYTLVWSDEFDGSSLDRNNWNVEINGSGCGNAELQYYLDTPSNVCVRDGNLVITARKEKYQDKNFTSGRLNTMDKVCFTYGIIEARIKLPKTANGLWPAFWMMGNDISEVSWPSCGETDILEMGHSNGIKGGVTDRLFNGALHWGVASSGHRFVTGDRVNEYSLQDGEYHIFRVVWTPDEIAMFLDDDKEPYMRVDISDRSSKDNVGYYFHKNNFLLINLAVGGNFPGIHEMEEITALPQGSAEMLVDYVRIYQKDDAKSTLTLLK